MNTSTLRHYEAACRRLDAIPARDEAPHRRPVRGDGVVRQRDIEPELVPPEPRPIHRRGLAEDEALIDCNARAQALCAARPELAARVGALMRDLYFAARRAAPAQVLEEAFQEGALAVLDGRSHRSTAFTRVVRQEDR